MIYHFDRYSLDTRAYQLRCEDQPIAIEPQVFNLLLYLAENCDRVVSRDELLNNLWPGKVVTDSAVSARLKGARRAVGDSGRAQRIIKTVHGRGYQFVATVTCSDSESSALASKNRELRGNPLGDFSSGKPSILVTPFFERSPDEDIRYVADAITDELRSGLCRFRQIIVFSREASMDADAFQSVADSQQIDVDYLLKGSVHKSGTAIRISVELTNANSGEHIWGDKYDRPFVDDVFAMVDDLAQSIISLLVGRIELDKRHIAMHKASSSSTAFDFYLRGNHYFRDWDCPRENLKPAIEMYSKAIELDPELAAAHAQLAAVHMQGVDKGWTDTPDEDIDAAMRLARQAIILDPNDQIANLALGAAYLYGRADPGMARTQFSIALDLNPNYFGTYCLTGWACICHGQYEEGRSCALEAIRRNPFMSDDCLWTFGFAEYLLGRYSQAIDAFARMSNPGPEINAGIAACYAQLDDLESARTVARQFEQSTDNPGRSVAAWRAYWLQHFRFEVERTLDLLIDGVRRAGLVD